jgi:heterodisulfide reductase subunit A
MMGSAALDIADAGYPVILVEKSDHLGGKMADLSGTYLNLSSAPDLLTRRIDRALHHPNIEVKVKAEVEQVEGYVGNFKATVKRVGQDGILSYDVGAVVAATGYDRYPLSRLSEYGGGAIPDVMDGLTFEAMLAPGAKLQRPSDGKTPREVVFVQCAGSRDPEHGVPYCSKVCCMYVAKQAMLFKERVPHGQAYVFYIDIRSAGKGYDEYVQRAMTEARALYLRGKVSKIFQDGDKVIVWGSDTLSNRAVEIAADLVVLATPMAAPDGAQELARRLHISTNADGFYNEAHPKLRPVESLIAGHFLAARPGPKDPKPFRKRAAAAKVLQL